MIELRDYQKKAVRELKQKMIDMLNDSEDRQKLIFKAPTGAGKTTIVKLLMRFYELNKGSIMIDGHDIKDFSRHDLRSLFGMVLQDTWLFNGTIKENLMYGFGLLQTSCISRVIAPCAISLVNEGRCVLLCLMSVIMWMVCILAMCSF